MRNKLFNKGATPKPSNMELLRKSITEFCHAVSFNDDEVRALIKEVGWHKDLDPVIYWKFKPVCTFEVSGTDDYAHLLKHNRLFGKNAILLETRLNKNTSGISSITENHELWLLEDMTLATVFACEMMVSDGRNTEKVVYRYPVENYRGFFSTDVKEFLTKINAWIYNTKHNM